MSRCISITSFFCGWSCFGENISNVSSFTHSRLSSFVKPEGRVPVISQMGMNRFNRKPIFILSKKKITKYKVAKSTLFENDRIYAACLINDDRIALATNNSGIYIIDKLGNIIQSFSKTEGLQNNNILSIFLDKQSNLWLGLDNGIDFIAYNSAIKQITPNFQDGSGYTALLHENRLYIGTSNGLFSVALQQTNDLSFSKGNFTPVENTKYAD